MGLCPARNPLLAGWPVELPVGGVPVVLQQQMGRQQVEREEPDPRFLIRVMARPLFQRLPRWE